MSSRFPAEADVVIKVQGVEPRLDVFAGLRVLPHVFGESREGFRVAVRSTFVEIGGPSLDFPRWVRKLGMRQDPFKDLPVALPGCQLFQEGFRIETKKPDEVLVSGRIVNVFAVALG